MKFYVKNNKSRINERIKYIQKLLPDKVLDLRLLQRLKAFNFEDNFEGGGFIDWSFDEPIRLMHSGGKFPDGWLISIFSIELLNPLTYEGLLEIQSYGDSKVFSEHELDYFFGEDIDPEGLNFVKEGVADEYENIFLNRLGTYLEGRITSFEDLIVEVSSAFGLSISLQSKRLSINEDFDWDFDVYEYHGAPGICVIQFGILGHIFAELMIGKQFETIIGQFYVKTLESSTLR